MSVKINSNTTQNNVSSLEPTFSIILPVHNGGDLLKRCVHSILNQDYRKFNLLILENHSSDDSLSWLISIKDDRINIFPSDQLLTLEENWARIAELPKNEFMTIIGLDDLFAPNYLRVMRDLIRRHPSASLYQTHFSYMNYSGRFI